MLVDGAGGLFFCRLCSEVGDLKLRQQYASKALPAQLFAQDVLFEVQEGPLIQKAYFAPHLAAKHHARSGRYLGVHLREAPQPFGGEEIARLDAETPPQRAGLHDELPCALLPACAGTVDTAVGGKNQRADHSAFRVLHQILLHRSDDVHSQARIIVEHHNATELVLLGEIFDTQIVAAGIAAVLRRNDNVLSGTFLQYRLLLGCGCVVNDTDSVFGAVAMTAYGLQTFQSLDGIVVVQYDYSDHKRVIPYKDNCFLLNLPFELKSDYE